MASYVRDLIEYHGIETCGHENASIFKQFNTENTFKLPTEKPDIEQIVKVRGEAKIKDYKIVKTPIGKSLEGQNVTGYKLLVCGTLKIQYEYVANEVTQSVHSAINTFPFCEYVVLPGDFYPQSMMFTTVCIEDMYSQQIGTREIYNNITAMIVVEVC